MPNLQMSVQERVSHTTATVSVLRGPSVARHRLMCRANTLLEEFGSFSYFLQQTEAGQFIMINISFVPERNLHETR